MGTVIFKKNCIRVFSIIIIIILSSIFCFSINYIQNIQSSLNRGNKGSELGENKVPKLAAQETLTAVWLENPTFEDPIEPIWYSKLNGDISDIEATAGGGNLNLKVIGDSRDMRIDESLSSTNWSPFENPDLPILPDTYVINSSGCYVSHLWHEDINQTRNRPSVHWKRTINMPVNMSDYKITSASLEVIFSASVQALDHDGGGIEREGDPSPPIDDYSSGDFADFYVLLSDVEGTFEPIPIATNNTGAGKLGQDSPIISNFPDTPMDVIPQSVLIDSLNSVLSTNGINFTITLGIDIYCEDNEIGVDIDRWNSLIIRSFNFTFSYEKKINQFSSISWNQDGGKISDVSNDTVIINEARLNFKYKIDDNWTEASPNSEIRAYINTNKLSESIKLSKANSSFQEAKIGGLDITSLIPYNININFSIQVFLADGFSLDRNITIYLDDIYLNITYTVVFPDFQTNLEIFFNGVNKTSNPIYEHPVGNDLNITVKYPDGTGSHIPGAIVQISGNLTGTLEEDPLFKQYTIIFDANDLNVGIFYFKIVAHKINFELSTINPILTITPTETQNLQLFLNGENKTLDPLTDVPLDKTLNITVKYHTHLGTPISGAAVTLLGEGIIETLNESVVLSQYTLLVNSSIKLSYGVNLLTIKANKLNFENQSIYPRLTVRKINSVITAINNTDLIRIRPGEDANIQVYINNTDFNEIIKGAIVTYTWEEGDGILNDDDNDGIYEVNLLDVPAGTYTIKINAFGGDKYYFVSLNIVLIASKPTQSTFLFRVLLIIGIVVSIGLGGYLYAYQKVLKYPKTVRKVRKYRRALRKSNPPRISVLESKKAFDIAYLAQLGIISKLIKSKPPQIEKEKISEKGLKNSEVDLITKPNNLNSNFYNTNNIHKNKLIKHQKLGKQLKIKLKKFWYGSLKFNKYGKSFYVFIILIIIIFYSLIIIPLFNQNIFNLSENSINSLVIDNVNNIGMSGQASYKKQWLNNTSFDDPIEPTWFPLYGDLGDNSDVKALPGVGQVNYTIIGDSGIMSIDNPLSVSDWTSFNNPKYPIAPDNYGINASGCYVSHIWNENIDQTRNTPSMQWKRNVTLPVNLSDYIITSASLEVIFNASVQADDHDGGGIEVKGDYTEGERWWPPYNETQFGIGDSATFYARISDLENSFSFPIASNKTTNLGRDSPNTIDSHPDTPLNVISENLLKSYLTSVLSDDGFNFTITLGIDIYCEDNEYNVDIDRWKLLVIRSFNLTFTYERKIDQGTSVSWNQNADKISDISNDTIVVDEALLNFKYKIDQNWTSSSPNSEIRILINNNLHPETVKLSTASTSFQEAKTGGFDVTSLIVDDVNLSVEVFLADKFSLDRNITISIDDVILNISYTIIFPDKETDLHLFFNSINKTDDPNFDIFIGDSLNITVKYLNKTGMHIPNATVRVIGNLTDDLLEDELQEQYTAIINTDTSNAGVNFITIIAEAEDHKTSIINSIITVKKFSTKDLQVILNNQNVTQDPYIELIVSDFLNVTVKYTELMGTHISGANVLLTSETFTSYLNESVNFKQYSILIDTNKSLKIGFNYLTVKAQTETYQTKIVDITVSIRKINIKIEPVSGSNTITSRTGADVQLQIRLNNTDFGGFIRGAVVTYTWERGGGILNDDDNDGIYETTIRNIPEGSYTIEISAFTGDDYYIENYEIYISATSEEAPENIIFPILFTISVIIISGLTSYLYAYQTYLKYPKQVRKVRKYRKSLRKKDAPSIPIMGSEYAFKSIYNTNLGMLSSVLRLKRRSTTKKSSEKDLPPNKIEGKSIEQKMEPDQLIDKSIEKKKELDDIVEKPFNEKK
ncbi:MAG: hypothetical protein ACFE91_05665 [Promethearchaeota archaeon]